jgi:hypothetical protein
MRGLLLPRLPLLLDMGEPGASGVRRRFFAGFAGASPSSVRANAEALCKEETSTAAGALVGWATCEGEDSGSAVGERRWGGTSVAYESRIVDPNGRRSDENGANVCDGCAADESLRTIGDALGLAIPAGRSNTPASINTTEMIRLSSSVPRREPLAAVAARCASSTEENRT